MPSSRPWNPKAGKSYPLYDINASLLSRKITHADLPVYRSGELSTTIPASFPR